MMRKQKEEHFQSHRVKGSARKDDGFGRYDTLTAVEKKATTSSNKKSVRIAPSTSLSPGGSYRKRSLRSRRKSTPFKLVSVTPVRRSARLGTPSKMNPEAIEFTPNKYIPELSQNLQEELQHILHSKT